MPPEAMDASDDEDLNDAEGMTRVAAMDGMVLSVKSNMSYVHKDAVNYFVHGTCLSLLQCSCLVVFEKTRNPRMCTGQSNNVDGKKWDVYSLSIVFAFVFTGKEVLHRPQPYPANCSCTRNFASLIMCPDYRVHAKALNTFLLCNTSRRYTQA